MEVGREGKARGPRAGEGGEEERRRDEGKGGGERENPHDENKGVTPRLLSRRMKARRHNSHFPFISVFFFFVVSLISHN